MQEPTVTVITLPSFDTGQYEKSEFLLSDGNAVLTIHLAEMSPLKITFSRVRWHQFTALYNCTAEMVKAAYFAVAEIPRSNSLAAYIASDRATRKAYDELHHYQIFLDETGCHEVYAERCVLS